MKKHLFEIMKIYEEFRREILQVHPKLTPYGISINRRSGDNVPYCTLIVNVFTDMYNIELDKGQLHDISNIFLKYGFPKPRIDEGKELIRITSQLDIDQIRITEIDPFEEELEAIMKEV